MESQFIIPVGRSDGTTINMEVRQKNINGKKRKVKTWTADEDNQLIELYQKFPKKWALIASLMYDRN
jgi:hypothetical protein